MQQTRPYREQDLAQIFVLIEQNLREINSHVYEPAIIEFMILHYAEVVKTNIFRSFSLFLVIEDDAKNEIIGCAGWKPASQDSKSAYISSMFISVPWHRHGLGRILINNLATHAKKNGCDKIICAASLNAIGFYERLGFQRIGLRDAGNYGQVMDMMRTIEIL